MTPENRNYFQRLGVVMKCATAGVPASSIANTPIAGDVTSVTKVADNMLESSLDTGVKGLALVSALAGVPIGALWHLVSNNAAESNLKADNISAQADIYRNAATDIERSLGKQLRSNEGVKNYETDSRNPYRLAAAQ